MTRVASAVGIALLALCLAGAAQAAPVAAPAPGTCVENWSDAAPIVAREGLMPARDIQHYARSRHGSDLVRITLCREEQGYVYRLLLRDDRGQITHFKINALPVPTAGSATAGR